MPMRPKEYLSEVGRLRGAIQHIEWERDALYANLYGNSVSYDRERVQSAGHGDKLAAVVAKAMELDNDLSAKTVQYFARMHAISEQIESMPQETHTRLLFLRYVQGDALEDIAKKMGYTYEHVRRLHGQALRAFGEKFAKEMEEYETCYTMLH